MCKLSYVILLASGQSLLYIQLFYWVMAITNSRYLRTKLESSTYILYDN